MTKEQFDAARKRIRDSWNGSVTFTKQDAETIVAEIAWLKRRLQRVEHAIEPLVEVLRRRARIRRSAPEDRTSPTYQSTTRDGAFSKRTNISGFSSISHRQWMTLPASPTSPDGARVRFFL